MACYPDDDPSSFENEEVEEEEEAETLVNAQETISAAIRLATNLSNRGKLPDVFLRHLRNAVLRLTEPEDEDDGFYDSLEDNTGIAEDCICGKPIGIVQPSQALLPDTVQSPESSFGEAWGWQNPSVVSKPEGISLSDSTREFWERGGRRLARSPTLSPSTASPSPAPSLRAPLSYADHYRTGAIPRRLFPDPGGRFPCECDSPATPCLVTGPISWTPSPNSTGPASSISSPESSYRGLPVGAIPRRLFPDPGGRFPCECDSPATPCLVTGPISWTPSPNSTGPASSISSPESSYRGLPVSPGQSPESTRAVRSSMECSCLPDSTTGRRSKSSAGGSIPRLPSPDSSLARGASGEPDITSSVRSPGVSSRRGASAPSPSSSSWFRGSWPGEAAATSPRSPAFSNYSRNVTSPATFLRQGVTSSPANNGRLNSTWTGAPSSSLPVSPDTTCQHESVSGSQFLPNINSTNISGSWGTPSRVTSTRSPLNPASSFVSEQSSGSIPSWRINADRNAMAGNYGVHSWTGSPRSRSLSPVRRRRQPVAEFEFVPSEDSSMGTKSWRSRSSGASNRSPMVSFPDTTTFAEQSCAPCSVHSQSPEVTSYTRNTFGGVPSSPQYFPFRFRRNWSISPAGAQPGELSREESWRYAR